MKPLLLLAAVVPLAAQCTFTVTPAPAPAAASVIPAAGGTGTVTVDTQSGCTWNYRLAQTTPVWFTITSGQVANKPITGGATVAWTATANPYPNTQRTASITFQPQVTGGPVEVDFKQGLPACSLALSPQSAGIGSGGGSGSFSVDTNCAWSTGSSSAGWFHVTGATGSGNGSVSYTADPNGCVTGRNASVPVVQVPPNPLFTINQDGSPDNLTVTPAAVTIPATATTNPVMAQVSTGTGCGWSSSRDVSWLRVASGGSGSGIATMLVVADANPNPDPRTGHIVLTPGKAVLTVTQQGTPVPVPQVSTIKNAASWVLAADAAGGAAGAVSPGEIVALEGANLGPVSGVELQLNPDKLSISRTLAGVQVLFDGTPAALTWVSDKQINAIVPYGVTGSTSVQVQAQNGASNVLTVPVQPTTPGIFTLDASGQGGGAIINVQDRNVNGPAHPAAQGSWVSIYCNGGGATNPASVDAALTGLAEPFPRLIAQPVSVTIGGIPSPNIQYAGGTPSVVSGLTQITAVVPTGLPSGPNPVLVEIGGQPSQRNVTIYVQ
jgi:uncharacterized protein (TIGR03437 family)